MFGCLKGCLGKIVLLFFLVIAAYVGWRWGPAFFPRVEAWLGMGPGEVVSVPGASPELADSVLDKVQVLQDEEAGAEVALTGQELTSVILFSVPGLVPEGVDHPAVELEDGRVRLTARVALSAFPDLPDLGPVLGILPDTLDVRMEGSLLPFGEGEAALLVQSLEASRIPLPRRLIPEILRAMGRVDRPGLPPEALALPLPTGLASAYIRGDSLILSRQP